MPEKIPDNILKVSERALRRNNLKVLEARNSKDILPYGPKIFELINIAYKDLYNVTPLNPEQIRLYTKQYFSFIDPDFVKLILDEDNNLIAFGIGFPSLAKALKKANGKLFPLGFLHLLKALKFNNRIEFVLIAIHPKYQGKGINAILFNEMIISCKRRGVKLADCNPQLENNTKVRSQWKHFKHRQHKVRTSFVKEL